MAKRPNKLIQRMKQAVKFAKDTKGMIAKPMLDPLNLQLPTDAEVLKYYGTPHLDIDAIINTPIVSIDSWSMTSIKQFQDHIWNDEGIRINIDELNGHNAVYHWTRHKRSRDSGTVNTFMRSKIFPYINGHRYEIVDGNSNVVTDLTMKLKTLRNSYKEGK